MSRFATVVRVVGLFLALVALPVAGCGVDPQAAPETIAVTPVPTAPSATSEGIPGERIVLWFLRDGRLAPAVRSASASEQPAPLDLLTAGPTPREVATGLRTTVAQQPLALVDDDPADGTVTVQVSPQFTSVTGADQLRAVAQVVWTVTEAPEAERVRFTTDEGPLQVPTDQGLTDAAVDRDDYASVAPRPANAEPSAGADPTTTPDR